MTILINIIIFLIIFYSVTVKSRKSLHMLQQNLYNENNRYIKWILKNKTQFVDLDLIIIAILLIITLILYDINYFNIIGFSVLIILNFILGYKWMRKIEMDQNKKPLVVTK